MCRVLMYKGDAVSLDDLLYNPNNSLVKQAYDPQMLNMLSLAGFGMLAWDDSSHQPGRPVQLSLRQHSGIRSKPQGARRKASRHDLDRPHSRRAVPSRTRRWGSRTSTRFATRDTGWLWPTTVTLAAFDRMRFALSEHIKPEIARLIRGNTDTEWLYALLLSQFGDRSGRIRTPRRSYKRWRGCCRSCATCARRHDIQISSPTNLFLSDGSMPGGGPIRVRLRLL